MEGVKTAVQNFFITLGVLFSTALVTTLTRPLLNCIATTGTYFHTTKDYVRAYAIRGFPPVLLYFLAGLACIALVDSRRKVAWAACTVLLGVVCSTILYSEGLTGQIAFKYEIERHLPYALPLLGLTSGTLTGLIGKMRGLW